MADFLISGKQVTIIQSPNNCLPSSIYGDFGHTIFVLCYLNLRVPTGNDQKNVGLISYLFTHFPFVVAHNTGHTHVKSFVL